MIKSIFKFLLFIHLLMVALGTRSPTSSLYAASAVFCYLSLNIDPVLIFYAGIPLWFVCSAFITLVLSSFYSNAFNEWVTWDKNGGDIWRGLLNWIFETGPYKFGDRQNTVSAILGANLHTGQAIWFDWLFTQLLDRAPLKIGSTHCKEAFKAESNKGYGVFKR